MSETSSVLKPAINFLQHYKPFAQMSASHQEYLAMHLEQVFFSEGDIILSSNQELNDYFYIIRSGLVSAENKTEMGSELHKELITQGSCFPGVELMNHTVDKFCYIAVKSTICYQLKYSHFEYLMQQSNYFHRFIDQSGQLD